MHDNASHTDGDLCSDLARIDKELLMLHKQRLDILRTLNRRLLINQLPFELISRILVLATEFNQVSSKNLDGPSYKWSPVHLLGAVCKDWREITLATPQLWSILTIEPFKDCAWPIMVKKWLARSGAYPLSITLACPNRADNVSRETDLGSMFSILRSQSHRWKSIIFDKIPYSVFHGLLCNLENSAQIETFRINCTHDNWGRNHITIREPFRPKTFHGSELFGTSEVLFATTFIRWDNLTYLDVTSIFSGDLVHIILHAIKLEHCIVKLSRHTHATAPIRRRGIPLPAVPVLDQSLIHLNINISDDVSFLRYIVLPSLQILEYKTRVGYIQVGQISILADFFDRSQAPFRVVALAPTFRHGMPYVPYDRFWDSRLPNATHIVFTVIIEDRNEITRDKILEPFTYDRDNVPYPSLQILELNTLYMTSTTWSHFINVFVQINTGTDITNTLYHRPVFKACVRLIKKEGITFDGSDIMELHHYLQLLEIQRSGVELELIGRDGDDMLQYASRIYG